MKKWHISYIVGTFLAMVVVLSGCVTPEVGKIVKVESCECDNDVCYTVWVEIANVNKGDNIFYIKSIALREAIDEYEQSKLLKDCKQPSQTNVEAEIPPIIEVTIVDAPYKHWELICPVCGASNFENIPIGQTSGDFECSRCHAILHWELSDQSK